MTPLQFSCDNEPLTFIGLHVQEIEKYYKFIKLISCSPVTTYPVHAFYLDLLLGLLLFFPMSCMQWNCYKFVDVALFYRMPCLYILIFVPL